jgi:antirestriction protein ArdC
MAKEYERRDRHQEFAQSIINILDQGERPWFAPWSSQHEAGPVSRPRRWDGTPYRGSNVLSLWMASTALGFTSPFWLSFLKTKDLGGAVRKGSTSSTVFFASTIQKEEPTDTGETAAKDIHFLKAFPVFNADQCEGLPAHFYAVAHPNEDPPEDTMETFVRNMGVDLRRSTQIRAYYSPKDDYVHLPLREVFRSNAALNCTAAHECVGHWTGHKSRLNREFGKWGSHAYAAEEMAAEISAAMVCADLGVPAEPLENSAAYIAGFAALLKDKPKAIFNAAAMAQAAVDYAFALQPKQALPELKIAS